MSLDRRSAASAPALAAAVVGALLLTLPATASAQTADGESVSDRLTELTDTNSRLYLHPISSGLGAGLNSGFFQTADSGDGIHVSVGVQVSGSLIPRDGDTFQPELPGSVTIQGRTFSDPYGSGDTIITPTAAGEGQGRLLEPSGEAEAALQDIGEDPADYAIRFPDGFDIPAVPIVLGEATLELPTGTGVMVRLLPEVNVSDEVGPISSYGLGVRQSVTAFLDRPPVDVAVAAGHQELTLGDVVDASGTSVDLTVSKDLDLITVFASGGFEDTDVDVEYTLENAVDVPGQSTGSRTVAFQDDGENSSRFTGGVHMNLFVARLSISYTTSSYDVLQARLSFGS